MQGSFAFMFFAGTVLVSIGALQGSSSWFPFSSSGAASGGVSHPDDGTVPMVLQNFHESTNKYINKNVIPGHQRASYKYLMMATYFDRADVALPGFSKYFREASEREAKNANYLMTYLNRRGGDVALRDIVAPTRSRWVDGVEAMEDMLNTERALNADLLLLHEMGDTRTDPHLTHIVEDAFLEQKVKVIKEVADHLANLEAMRGADYGLGEYIFDKEL